MVNEGRFAGESMEGHDSMEHGRWIETVVERYEGRLLRYASQITGDVDRGRDVVQDTFVRLCRESPSNVDGHLAEWLYVVCRNRALDVRRKEKRMQTITDEQSATQPSREPSQAESAETQDISRHVLQLVDGLTDNQREVVRLKFQNGLSYKEISRITELSVSNVGYLIHTAIRKLRTKLGVQG